MGLHDPLPDGLADILKEIVEINDTIERLAFSARHKEEFPSGKIALDVFAALIALLLGGPTTLPGLALMIYAFGSPAYDVMRMLAKTKGHVEIEALRDALIVRRALLWRKAKILDPSI